MSWLELVPLEGGAPINLPDGQTVVGRGPFLGVNDKRVSRNHAVLENLDGRLRLKPTHSNPCFVQSSLEDAPRALERERWYSLHHGDIFSLLPGKLLYRLESVGGEEEDTPRNSQEFDPEETSATQLPVSQPVSPPVSPPVSQPVSLSEDHKQAVSLSEDHKQAVSLSEDHKQPVSLAEARSEKEVTQLKEEEEEEDNGSCNFNKTQSEDRRTVCSPEVKRRVLPSWMSAASPSPKAGGGVRAPKRPRAVGGTSSGQTDRAPKVRKTTDEDHGTPKVRKTSDEGDRTPKVRKTSEEDDRTPKVRKTSDEDDGTPKVRKTSDEGDGTPKARKTSDEDARRPSQTAFRRRLQSDEEGEESDGMDVTEMEPQATPPTTTTTANQQQQQKQHGNGKSTNGQGEAATAAAGAESSRGSAGGSAQSTGGGRKACPYGKGCYRKNPLHFQEFSHHGDTDYEEDSDKHDDEEDEEDRPQCPYGTDCYRQNPLHRKEFKHTKRAARSSTRATRRRGDEDEDEEGDKETWDDEDSFINDEDSDDVWNDEDYAPPAGSDDSDGENVQTLQREAKAFMKNIR